MDFSLGAQMKQGTTAMWRKPLNWFGSDQSGWVKSRTDSALPGWIALAAGLGLFLELAVIRWHGALFSLFGFYKNFSLLSAFLGLGIGYAIGNRKPIRMGYVILCLFTQMAFFGGMKVLGYQHYIMNPISELLTMGLDATQGWGGWAIVVGFLSLVFIVNALTFIPIGQIAGALMGRVANLRAYGFNLLGSLAGILAFTAASYLWLPPEAWFGLAIFGVLVMMGRDAAHPAVLAASVLFAVFCIYEPRPLRKNIFSPYQALSIRPVNNESRVVVSVNNLYYQKILDLSNAVTERNGNAQFSALTYDLPFKLKRRPSEVLIVGAGTGNDIAAALRGGAGHVDAVEIDPIIQRIGSELHPENPYQSERVTAHINDARAYMRSTDKRYDLIVYGLLDSHTMLSSLSNVRLDSFVYTVEGFQDAAKRLNNTGVVAVSFSLISEGLGHKLFRMLKSAFHGQDPVVLRPGYDGSVIFVAGPGAANLETTSMKNVAADYANYQGQVDVSTDDWPFFYMPLRQYPTSYAMIIGMLLLLSFGLIATVIPKQERASFNSHSLVFFFLGAGFMLVETRSITELGLTFGNTWLVVAVVISAILFMAWCANLTVNYFPKFPSSLAFACLAASLAGGWYLTGEPTLSLSAGTKTLLCVLPLLFSGLLFSSALKETTSLSQAMAANLFGSICGGLMEYHSMVAGFRSLYLLGLAMYAGAYAAFVWSQYGNTLGRKAFRPHARAA
jgi:spermidine synthase